MVSGLGGNVQRKANPGTYLKNLKMWQKMKDFLRKYRPYLISWLILGTVTTIVLAVVMKIRKSRAEAEAETEPETETDNQTNKYLIDKELAEYLIQYLSDAGFDPALSKMIVAQSRHETGNYTSRLFKEYNNPWGMMHPLKRTTASAGANPSGFATYISLSDAARDYVYYLQALDYNETYPDVRAFVSELKKKGYFEDNLTTYMSSVNSIYKSLKISV